MAEFIDMTGQKFGRLLIVSRGQNKGTRASWNCVCECGGEVTISGKRLRTGHTKSCGCLRKEITAKQGKLNKLNIKDVEEKLLLNKFKLLSEYNGIQTPASFQCLDCGFVFMRRVESSLYGILGCPSCSKSLNGFIGSEYFNKNPEMAEIPCKLYLIEFTGNGEHFWKIGITRQTIKERIRKIPYSGNLISFIEKPMKEIYEMEKELKKINKTNRYRPKLKFNGHSECFIVPIQIQILLSQINK